MNEHKAERLVQMGWAVLVLGALAVLVLVPAFFLGIPWLLREAWEIVAVAHFGAPSFGYWSCAVVFGVILVAAGVVRHAIGRN